MFGRTLQCPFLTEMCSLLIFVIPAVPGTIMYLITPELYSTKYRAVGMGSCSVVTRLGGALCCDLRHHCFFFTGRSRYRSMIPYLRGKNLIVMFWKNSNICRMVRVVLGLAVLLIPCMNFYALLLRDGAPRQFLQAYQSFFLNYLRNLFSVIYGGAAEAAVALLEYRFIDVLCGVTLFPAWPWHIGNICGFLFFCLTVRGAVMRVPHTAVAYTYPKQPTHRVDG